MEISAALVVPRQIGHVIVEPISEQRLYRFADLLMKQPAALGQQRVVGCVAGERVLEGVLNVAWRWLLVNEFARLGAC